jgi:DNA helicase II / ATP-dependent DNA helicase PcrA
VHVQNQLVLFYGSWTSVHPTLIIEAGEKETCLWTEMQTRIIQKTVGNTVVVASPGSGKTTVLTEHIVHQLRGTETDARTVMMITYTRQAAGELKQRLQHHGRDLGMSNLHALRIGTFHAEAFRMLLQTGFKVPPVLGTNQQYGLLRRILREQGLTEPAHVTALSQALTKTKSVWPTLPLPRQYRKAAKRYEDAKQTLGRWDYDDILVEFSAQFAVIKSAVPPVRYLLVDEFQDTNAIQWEIVCAFQRIWSSRLFVVGDDDQSIYGFRGASPKWLQAASDGNPATDTFVLSTNFRSDMQIVAAASELILHNQQRISKPFEASSTNEGSCGFTNWRDEEEEAQAVNRLLQWLRSSKPSWRVAILARTRRQLLASWTKADRDGRQRNAEWHTFHSSKGREWDAVIITGAVEANPYLREPVESEEEERRLFYVAMTRARHSLWVTYPERIQNMRTVPSKYIEETRMVRFPRNSWPQVLH